MPRGSTFRIPISPRFDLPRAVCSYGYFLLAPNYWNPLTRTLSRPLRGERDRVITVTVAQTPKPGADPRKSSKPRGSSLTVKCDSKITSAERTLLTAQLSRMLRLPDAARLRAWHKLHPTARRARFGVLFRSPTLFEDMVKTITGCNVTWTSTIRMNKLLCAKVGPPEVRGAFPTPRELAAWTPGRLAQACKVGYRAERIIRLARAVESGKLDLSWFEAEERTTGEVYEALLEIHGFGAYAAGNVCQLLGRYDRLAIDTETYRHFEQEHNLPRGENPKLIHPHIEAHYAKYAPFQFLAYWFDLWQGYQKRFGPAWQWDLATHAHLFTVSVLKKPHEPEVPRNGAKAR